MTIVNLLTINNTEITAHNRKLSIDEEISANDVDLASGHRRRFYTKNKKKFNLTWSYLPNLANKTVDNRAARDFLFSIANTSNYVSVAIELEPDGGFINYDCYLDSYSEALLRRDLTTNCVYYDVSVTLTER